MAAGRCRSITASDHSQRELQLKGAFGINNSTVMRSPASMTGDRLPLIVVWALGSTIGAEFIGHVRPEHPAIIALSQAAR